MSGKLMTEPHDGHEASVTCPGCPHQTLPMSAAPQPRPCRTKTADGQPQWLAAMPDDVAESLVVILYCAVEWSAHDEPEFEAALAFARLVNGSTP